MIKIGIFGGTFNPVHKGHEKIALEFYNKYELDKLIIIPSNIPPHKQINGQVTAEQRYEMCRICFDKYDNICVSDLEIKNDNISYSYNTVTEIKNNNKDAKLYFLIGSDMFLYLEKWYKYQELLKLCTFVVAYRDDNIIIKSGAEIEFLENEPFEISSSEIRADIKNNNYNLEKYINAEVLNYIRENKIYAE